MIYAPRGVRWFKFPRVFQSVIQKKKSFSIIHGTLTYGTCHRLPKPPTLILNLHYTYDYKTISLLWVILTMNNDKQLLREKLKEIDI